MGVLTKINKQDEIFTFPHSDLPTSISQGAGVIKFINQNASNLSFPTLVQNEFPFNPFSPGWRGGGTESDPPFFFNQLKSHPYFYLYLVSHKSYRSMITDEFYFVHITIKFLPCFFA